MSADTRNRMIEATVAALQRRGMAGMSFTDVLDASGAARGAIYHHFPAGKTQLVAEATERNGIDVLAHLAALPAGTPTDVVTSFLQALRPVLQDSACGGGCAVAAATIGSEPDIGPLRQIAATAFIAWIDQLARHLTTAGMDPRTAHDTATALIALLQGAHVLCRATGTITPFDDAARAAITLVDPR